VFRRYGMPHGHVNRLTFGAATTAARTFGILNSDSAVEMTPILRSRGEPGGAKTQKRKISIPSMVLGPGLAIFQASARPWRFAVRFSQKTHCLRSGGLAA
jgi:hypothetical protein